MSDAASSRSLTEDIAFIRSMVEEGRQSSYKGGIGLAAGLIWGTASLYTWAVWVKILDTPGGMAGVNWIWIAALILFALVGIPLGMYRRRGNRAVGAAWGAVGIGCFTISAVIALAGWRMHVWITVFLLPPMIMALYGGAWLVCSAALRSWWMTWTAAACLLASLLLAYTAGQPLEYLVFALSLYAFAGLPGLTSVLRKRRQA